MGWLNMNGIWIGRNSGLGSSYWINRHPELKTYITGLTTPLSEDQVIRLGKFLEAIKTGLDITLLSEVFDIMYILGGETEESSLKNLVKNAHHCTNVHATAFVAFEGFQTDGANDYLDTNYNPATAHAINYTLNSASLGVYSRTDLAGVEIGCRTALNNDSNYITVKNAASGGFAYYPITVDTATGTRVLNDLGNGLFVGSRTANNAAFLSRNKYVIHSNTVVSSQMPNQNMYICAMNSGGTPAFGANQNVFAFAGRGLLASEINIIADAFEVYLASNGKTLSPTSPLVFTFDDGLESNYTNALPIILAENIPVTFYINADKIGSVGYMSWANVLTLKNAGLDIQCHTFDHTLLTTLNQVQVEAEYDNNTSAFLLNGLSAPIHTAYPYGAHNDNVKSWTQGKRASARAVLEGFIEEEVDLYALPCYQATVDAATLRGYMSQAVSNNKPLILYGHGVDDGGGISITEAKFQDLINYAKSLKMNIIDIKSLIESIT